MSCFLAFFINSAIVFCLLFFTKPQETPFSFQASCHFAGSWKPLPSDCLMNRLTLDQLSSSNPEVYSTTSQGEFIDWKAWLLFPSCAICVINKMLLFPTSLSSLVSLDYPCCSPASLKPLLPIYGASQSAFIKYLMLSQLLPLSPLEENTPGAVFQRDFLSACQMCW